MITPDSVNVSEKVNSVENYYERYWDIEVVICKSNEVRTKLRNDKVNVLIPYNRIIPIAEMKMLLNCLKDAKNTYIEFKMKVWQMDSLGSHIFSKILDMVPDIVDKFANKD